MADRVKKKAKDRIVINDWFYHEHSQKTDPLEWILIINYGTELIESLIRSVYGMGVNVMVLDHTLCSDITLNEIKTHHNIKGFVLSGSTYNTVFFDNAPQVSLSILTSGIPILAICYSAQSVAYVGKCEVKENKSGQKEKGPVPLQIKKPSILWRGIDIHRTVVWMFHDFCPTSIPKGFIHTASTADCEFAAFEFGNLYCLHFHPEYFYSISGKMMIRNFLAFVCNLPTLYF